MPQSFSIAYFLQFALAVLCGPLFVHASDARVSSPSLPESVVWHKGEDAMSSHFVYGLTISTKGALLAFSEARLEAGDDTPHHLVLKRSSDAGVTWSDDIMIERADGVFWRGKGVEGRLECWANPAAIADRETGRVFVFYVLNEGRLEGVRHAQRYTRVFLRSSDDEGLTWSDRLEVTDLLNAKADGSPNRDVQGQQILDLHGHPCDHLGRAFHMPGPGHGLQLKNGRMFMQFWSRVSLGDKEGNVIPIDQRRYGIRLLYSDDHGRTWRTGASFGEGLPAIESRMVELDSGDLYLNARTGNGRNAQRGIMISSDGGATWQSERFDSAMPRFVSVDCGLVSVHRDGQQILLMSHPRNPNRRSELTISASTDGGKAWAIHHPVHEEGANYSDLVALPDGRVGLLYGKGETAREGFDVRFFSFKLSEIGL
jgi:sialidase-1